MIDRVRCRTPHTHHSIRKKSTRHTLFGLGEKQKNERIVNLDEAQYRVGAISKAKASLLACDGICHPSHSNFFRAMDIEGKPFSKRSHTVATSARDSHRIGGPTIPFSFPEPLRETIACLTEDKQRWVKITV